MSEKRWQRMVRAMKCGGALPNQPTTTIPERLEQKRGGPPGSKILGSVAAKHLRERGRAGAERAWRRTSPGEKSQGARLV